VNDDLLLTYTNVVQFRENCFSRKQYFFTEKPLGKQKRLARNDTETLSRLNLDKVDKSIQTFVSQEGEVCAAPSGEAGEACAAPSARSFSCFAFHILLLILIDSKWRV
jgi:hypothetical protein